MSSVEAYRAIYISVPVKQTIWKGEVIVSELKHDDRYSSPYGLGVSCSGNLPRSEDYEQILEVGTLPSGNVSGVCTGSARIVVLDFILLVVRYEGICWAMLR